MPKLINLISLHWVGLINNTALHRQENMLMVSYLVLAYSSSVIT